VAVAVIPGAAKAQPSDNGLPPGATVTGPTGGLSADGYVATPPPLAAPGAPAPDALVARLRGSQAARQGFALEALVYSRAITDAVPDGVDASVASLLGLLSIKAGPGANVPPTMTPGAYKAVRVWLDGLAPPLPHRSLPFTLPADVIAAVNADATAMDPGAPPLEVTPTAAGGGAGAVAPAG
jgi:hypothetical protein